MSNRTIRLAVLMWLGFASAVGVAHSADAVPPLNSIRQITMLSDEEIEFSPRAEVEGVVTLSISRRSYVWLEDVQAGIRLYLRNRNFVVQPGDRVRVKGVVVPGETGPMLAPDEVNVLGNSPLAEPPVRTVAQLNKFQDLDRRVQSEGRVRQVISKASRWQFEVESGTNRLWVELSRGTNENFSTWENATIRARGICVRQVFDFGETIQPALIVQSASDLTLLRHGQPVVEEKPEEMIVRPIASLTRESVSATTTRVRVRGKVLDQRLGEHLIVRDTSGTLRADSASMQILSLQEEVDVWGTPVWGAGGVHLQDAVFREAGTSNKVMQSSPSKATPRKRPATLPTLTKAADLLALSAEEASWRHPVRLRGVVLVYYPERRQFFIQDDSAGVYISGPWNRNDIKVGDLVEVTGISDPGGFAPMVAMPQVTVRGTTSMPPARRLTLFQMATGQYDSQWIEAFGVIRSYTHERNLLRVKVTDTDGTLFVYLPAETVPTNLVDSVVRIRGVCTTHPNANRQISTLVVWCPGLDFIQIEEPGTVDDSLLRPQPIASLGQYRPHNVLQRRVKVEGVVTLRQNGKSFFVQDGTTGVEVQTAREDEVARPGDRVLITGYPALGTYGVVLREAVLEVQGHRELPPANHLAPGRALHAPWHNMLVEVEARLRYRTRVNGRDVLTLQLPGILFEVDSLKPIASFDQLAAGSLLRVRGIYRIIVDEVRSPAGFQMVAASGDDIRVLETPSWWSYRHTLGLVGALLILVAATTLWVLMLRRKVREQTASLQTSETKFRSLVEQSLVGVYIIQNGRFAYLNPRMAEIFGYSADEVVAMGSVGDVIAPEDRQLVLNQIERRISGEIMTAHYTFRGLRKDGTFVQVEVLGSRSDFNGMPAVMGTALDVTARKRAEEELFSSRQMLRSILDTIPQRVFWKDRDFVYRGCNKAFAEDFALAEPADLNGKTDLDLHTDDIAQLCRAVDQEIVSNRSPKPTYEMLNTNHDGSQSWQRITKVPLFDKQGNVTGVLGTYEDVTEQKRAEAALAQASSLLETLLANSPDYIYFKDRESRFVRASESLARMFNVDSTEGLTGKSDFDFFKIDHAQQAFDDEQEIIRTGVPLVAKSERETHPDGRVTWALTTKIPWRDREGNIIGTFGISKDVTALKEAESRLAHEQGLFKALVENLPDAIYFKDRESRYVRLSQSKVERSRQLLITRFKAEHPDEPLPPHLASSDACLQHLIGKSDFDLYPEDRARSAFEQEQAILKTGNPLIGFIDTTVDDATGKPAWYHTTKMPWRNERGEIIGTFGVTRDITALKEAEAVLDYERELFRTLLDHFPDSIYFKDLESRFVRFSRSKAAAALEVVRANYVATNPSQALPGYLADLESFSDYLVGKSDFDTFSEERARDAFDDEQAIIRTGEPLLGKVERTKRIDGKVSWCISTKMAWRNRDGRIIGTFGVSKDITALKEAESQLESAHQRLVETSRLAGMAEVATDVLHNVGNVLNSVNISCSLAIDRIKTSKMASLTKVVGLLDSYRGRLVQLFDTPRGQQIPEYLSALADNLREDQTVLLKELEQLLKHIDHIKQIVAMQQSYAKVAGVKETITAEQLVEDALHINAAALVRHDVHVQKEFKPAPAISTEKHKVLQILVNLIRNAKYAMDDAKRQHKLLTIRIGMADGSVRIDVVDNGVGIPPENLTRIFGHGFTTRRNGHGFGLHSSAIAVKELGGALSAHSDGPGTGATFSLLLPCNPSPSPVPAQTYESAAT